jgi:hypothetical protein
MPIACRFMRSDLSVSLVVLASAVVLGGASALGACSSSSSSTSFDDAGAGGDAATDVGVADTSTPDTGNGGGDAGTDGPQEANADQVSCDNLCDSILAYCFAGDEQYTTKQHCVSACTGLPAGTLGDTADTIGCRQQEAYRSHSLPEKNCAAAGPFGGGVCGDRCASFCRTIVSACNGAPYANAAACMADCGSSYKFSSDAGTEYTTAGNSLNCREGVLLGILNSGMPGSATDCANAGPASTICR